MRARGHIEGDRGLTRIPFRIGLKLPEHRRVMCLQDLTVAEIHVDAAWQARIEAAHRAHDVDALEFFGAVLLEDGRVLHGIFVGTGRAVDIARIGIPRRGRIGMVVGDLVIRESPRDATKRRAPLHGIRSRWLLPAP